MYFSCSYDEGNLEIEIHFPAVRKENIELKMVENDFFIRAKREETGVEYVGLMRSSVGLFLRNCTGARLASILRNISSVELWFRKEMKRKNAPRN